MWIRFQVLKDLKKSKTCKQKEMENIIVNISRLAYFIATSIKIDIHRPYPTKRLLNTAEEPNLLAWSVMLDDCNLYRYAAGNVYLCPNSKQSMDIVNKIKLHVCVVELLEKKAFLNLS